MSRSLFESCFQIGILEIIVFFTLSILRIHLHISALGKFFIRDAQQTYGSKNLKRWPRKITYRYQFQSEIWFRYNFDCIFYTMWGNIFVFNFHISWFILRNVWLLIVIYYLVIKWRKLWLANADTWVKKVVSRYKTLILSIIALIISFVKWSTSFLKK